MLDWIRAAGGVSALIQFSPEFNGGERVYSAPWNAKATDRYQEAWRQPGILVCIDRYSDGTILSSSGYQSANNLRIRFSNLENETNNWYDVGIVPVVDTCRERKSDDALESEKVMPLQRFTYLVLKS